MATKSSRVNEEEKRQIIEMYANGTGDSVYLIVNKTGRTYKTIQKVLKDAGVYVENQDWLKNHQGVSKPTKADNSFKDKKKDTGAVTEHKDEKGISIDSFMSKLTASNMKSKSDDKKKSKAKANKYRFSKKEKTEYCDSLYGVGNWRFMTSDELREQLRKDFKIGVS